MHERLVIAMRELIVHDSVLSELVGDRMYLELAPPDAALPLLVYSFGTTELTEDDTSGTRTQRTPVLFSVYAESDAAAMAVRREIERLFKTERLACPSGVKHLQTDKVDDELAVDPDQSETGATVWVARVQLSFLFHYDPGE